MPYFTVCQHCGRLTEDPMVQSLEEKIAKLAKMREKITDYPDEKLCMCAEEELPDIVELRERVNRALHSKTVPDHIKRGIRYNFGHFKNHGTHLGPLIYVLSLADQYVWNEPAVE